MKKKYFPIITVVFSLLSMALFILPFIKIKKYHAVNGLELILNISNRVELTPISGSGTVLVIISYALPLLLSFAALFATAVFSLLYLIKRNKHFASISAAAAITAYVSYGAQLYRTGTSVVEFFATLLARFEAADGTVSYKLANQEVIIGSGARILVFAGLLSMVAAIMTKVLDYAERNAHDAIQTPWSIAFKIFKRNKLALVGLGIIAVFAIFCFYGPAFSNFALLETKISLAKKPPSLKYLFGTDAIGRDILTRLMYGGRISLTVGFVAVLIEIFIGTLVGGVAGYYGGKVDSYLMRIVDIFMSLPYLPVVIILGSIMSDLNIPPQQRIYFVMLIIGLLNWPYLTRIIRGQILSLREQEFMLAAESLGLSVKRKIIRHLIPNVIPQIIVSATLGIGGAILSESALSFLGLGVAMPYPSWGNMIQAVNDPYDFAYRTWFWIPPGMFIFITVLAVNLVGDGLRDAFDPKMKR